MFAFCIETSHTRGMGHLFRAIHVSRALKQAGRRCMILLNDHEASLRILRSAGISHQVADLSDFEGDWEGKLIADEKILVWVNDRLNTDVRQAAKVKRRGIPLVTFDDRGSGAALADLHIAALAFDPAETLAGCRVLRGMKYLVLNPEIAEFRRIRNNANAMLVTMGGSDTYGVTVKVARLLRSLGRSATIVVGPGFRHESELMQAVGPAYEVKRNVPSLIAEFSKYDLAITGAGITGFEANASGLPCILVANEHFEVPNAMELARLGGAIYAGHHERMDESVFARDIPVEAMSRAGLAGLDLGGVDRVVKELASL